GSRCRSSSAVEHVIPTSPLIRRVLKRAEDSGLSDTVCWRFKSAFAFGVNSSIRKSDSAYPNRSLPAVSFCTLHSSFIIQLMGRSCESDFTRPITSASPRIRCCHSPGFDFRDIHIAASAEQADARFVRLIGMLLEESLTIVGEDFHNPSVNEDP